MRKAHTWPGCEQDEDPDAKLAWAIVGCVLLTSVFVHGVTAYPIMGTIERRTASD